jgi:DNA-binding transcriptional LysR family regulator
MAGRLADADVRLKRPQACVWTDCSGERWRVPMELHQVRYYLAVCRTLNFTRAAEECHVTQPALSRAVQQLEAELGGELFRRERNLTHVTDLGRIVHTALTQCYESSINAKALAQSFHKGGHAPLHLALARTIDMEQVSPLLGEVSNAFPDIEINIFRGPPHEMAEKMKSGDVELAVAEPLGDNWERFEAKQLYEEQFGLLMSRKHRLAQRNGIELKDLAQEKLLCRPHCSLTDMLVTKLRDLGAQDLARHEVPLIEDMAGMVRANLGVGIWPMSRAIAGDVALNRIHGVDMKAWISLYTVFGRRLSTAAATFIRLLRAKDWSGSSNLMETLH